MIPFGISRRERLRKRKEFLAVYEKGKRVRGRHLYLYILENSLPVSRLGLTVSRKIGKTVTRNRIKRRLREVFRNNKRRIAPTSDVVINVKKTAAGASLEELQTDFMQAVGRAEREGKGP